MASRISTSDLPARSLAAANPPRSGTVSKSQTMRFAFMLVAALQEGSPLLSAGAPALNFMVRPKTCQTHRLLELTDL
jgi:hypothetical protein